MTRVLVMAGGTGGHVMPALAVAERLREHGVEVLWIGAGGVEAELVPKAGFELMRIRIKGARQSGLKRLLAMPFMLAWAMAQMARIIRRRQPDVALGMGGFVSGPGGLVAGLLRRPLVLHEQNTIAGLTNRSLARLRFATRVLSGFPAISGIDDFTWVGNPVRRDIIALPPPEARLAGRVGALRLLVVGGSRGAAVFNHHLPELLARAEVAVEVRHQCGRSNREATEARYRDAGRAEVSAEVAEFIDDMAAAYSWCDLVICRAGASTVSEVCAAGVAAIFVPYPHAVSDHQAANAAYLHAQSAAKLVRQDDFVRGEWLNGLREFDRDRARLLTMAQAARQLAKPSAASAVAEICMEAANA